MSRRKPVTPQDLDTHLTKAEALIAEASLYLWDLVNELDTITPHDADALVRRLQDHLAETLQPQLTDLARFVLVQEVTP
jgi:hypothetical protein